LIAAAAAGAGEVIHAASCPIYASREEEEQNAERRERIAIQSRRTALAESRGQNPIHFICDKMLNNAHSG